MSIKKDFITGDALPAKDVNDMNTVSRGLGAHEQEAADLTLLIEAGVIRIEGTLVKFAGGNSPSFTAPSANPRVDLLTIDNTGTLARVIGAEGASPVTPDYPRDKSVIVEVFNRVGQTTILNADDSSNGFIQKDGRQLFFDPTPPAAISIWAGAAAPGGWFLCDGQAVSRTTFADLFAEIGTTYGVGDGSTTFNVPNLKGKAPIGLDSGIADFDALNKQGGEKEHTLTTPEMPSHNHGVTAPTSDNVGSIAGWFRGPNNFGNTTIGSDSTGGGNAHENMPPFVILNYIIKF